MTRKIEDHMRYALRARRAWRLSNTEVVPVTREDGKPLARVYLHGNHIATLGYDESGRVCDIAWSMAGWSTRTTASRLNAILGDFSKVWQRVGFYKFEPELRFADGRKPEPLNPSAWNLAEMKP